MARRIDVLLLCLVALDATIAATAFSSPRLWYAAFHGVAYVDPQGLLRRMAANWSAFALVQSWAFLRWRAKPFWLTVVAGVRLSDMFTDWTYLYFCHDITWFGRISLTLVSPLNVLIGWYLIETYARIRGRPESDRP